MEILVTQEDIANATPDDSEGNCVALAIRRVKRRDDVYVRPYLGSIRIGTRIFELDDYACNRLIRHSAGDKIEAFVFDFGKLISRARNV